MTGGHTAISVEAMPIAELKARVEKNERVLGLLISWLRAELGAAGTKDLLDNLHPPEPR
jgi:hypothetical protein